MKFQRNVSLREYNTFRVGGKAEYFFCAKNKEDLIKAIKEANNKKLPFFVLGKGSNILFLEKNIKCVFIKNDIDFFNQKGNEVCVGSGFFLPKLVSKLTKASLSGIEWAAGIPGTLGGAVFGNAGSFGFSISDAIKEVEAYDVKKDEIVFLKNKDCKFSYRKSIFRKKKNLIILSVVLKLRKENKKLIKKNILEYLKRKKETQPLEYPTAGSVFKNPKGKYAADLIERCGLKGKTIGGAKISEKHANFIVNFKNAKAKDIEKLISLSKKEVEKKFKIILQEEIIIF